MNPARPHTRRARWTLVGLTIATLLAGGCSTEGPTVPDTYTKLMRRPDIDQAQATYTEMLTAIRDRLTAEFGRTWEQRGDLSGAACLNDYPGLNADGESRTLPRWLSPGNLPDNQWARAQTLLGEIATKYGFQPTPTIRVDKPGEHDVVYHKRDGLPDETLLYFGTAKNTDISVSTGCHLTADAHRRGGPAPSPGT
ncbi:LppA family lipoprotein [Amycolatopsis samaneae]|uniref:LppA family lipoprotein n=2 Tax=Amycolatopsis samaneae TaxID=664691 RepID=A0ABW5GKB9_9PSEU